VGNNLLSNTDPTGMDSEDAANDPGDDNSPAAQEQRQRQVPIPNIPPPADPIGGVGTLIPTGPVLPISNDIEHDPVPPFHPISEDQISSVRSLMEGALSNPFCAAFSSAWLNQLGVVTGVPPVSDDPLVLFNQLASTNGVKGTDEAGVMGRASGAIGAGDASIGLNLNNILVVSPAVGPAAAIHETAHVAPGSGALKDQYYSHDDMNQAAFDVLSRWRVIGPQGVLNTGPFRQYNEKFKELV
jgi:hypothetical protein